MADVMRDWRDETNSEIQKLTGVVPPKDDAGNVVMTPEYMEALRAKELTVCDAMCHEVEDRIRGILMDLNSMLGVDGFEIVSATVGGPPNFSTEIVYDER